MILVLFLLKLLRHGTLLVLHEISFSGRAKNTTGTLLYQCSHVFWCTSLNRKLICPSVFCVAIIQGWVSHSYPEFRLLFQPFQ